MPERIPELDRLAAGAKETPMLPPTEVRRRGDRRRMIRRSSIAAVAVTAITALGVGVWASPLMDGAREPQWANTAVPSPTASASDPTVVASPSVEPTPSTEPSPSVDATLSPDPTGVAPGVDAPSWANVPTLEDIRWDVPAGPNIDEYEGMGQSAKGLCDPGSYGDPTTVLVRDFAYEEGGYITAVVLGYPTDEAASAGYDLLTESAATCEDQLAGIPLERPSAEHNTDLPFDPAWVSTTPSRADHFIAMGALPGQDSGLFNISMMVQAGNRVAWLVEVAEGQDYNCSVRADNEVAGQCRFPEILPDVAARLSSDMG